MDRDYQDGDRVKRVWNREGTVIGWSMPHLEGGAEYLVKWDGLGGTEWMKPAELEVGSPPDVSDEHEHHYDFFTRERGRPYFMCRCGEYLSWEEAQARLNK